MHDHTSVIIDALLFGWDKNRSYGGKLVGDVPDDQMVFQPAPGMNHPAWVLCHLNAYHPVIVCLAQGRLFDDPKDHPFGMKSKPVSDASAYPSRSQLVEVFERGHDQVTAALRSCKPDKLAGPVPLERWQSVMPSIGAALAYLMLLHESAHLGQLSAWRRVQGLPSV